jgi:hypothetical protein
VLFPDLPGSRFDRGGFYAGQHSTNYLLELVAITCSEIDPAALHPTSNYSPVYPVFATFIPHGALIADVKLQTSPFLHAECWYINPELPLEENKCL